MDSWLRMNIMHQHKHVKEILERQRLGINSSKTKGTDKWGGGGRPTEDATNQLHRFITTWK